MPIYLKFDGIEGDVTAEGHDKWIELQSVQWGSSRAITTSGDANHRNKSAVAVSEVVITRDSDSCSGKLWRAHLMGDPKTAQIDWCKTDRDKMAVYQSLKLSNTLISSYAQSGHSGAARPAESLSFNFTEIEGTFYDLVQEGAKPSKPFVQSYNLSAQK